MRIKVLFTLLGIFTHLLAFGQTDEDLIRHSIHNYFNGTAYNHLDQIELAFYPDATLYLENREGVLMKLSPAEYITLFEKNTPGTFSGRYNKIISIEIEGDLAQVKAEILVPAWNRRYIDIFIMKETEPDHWQIISKAANSSPIKEE